MKILIDIPDEVVDNLEDYSSNYFKKVIENGTCLNNITRGMTIELILPDFLVSKYGDEVQMGRFNPYCECHFDRKWWDSPYIEEANK